MKRIDELIEKIGFENTVLFVGAGFNNGIENIMRNEMPYSHQLVNQMIELFPYSEQERYKKANLQIDALSDLLVKKNFSHELISLIIENFTMNVNQMNIPQNIISKVRWKNIYTTNYDNVLETIFNRNYENYAPVVLGDSMKDYLKRNKIIHINGHIDSLSPENFKEQLRLTADSYNLNTEAFINSDWIKQFRQDLTTAECVIFIGVSMNSDIDVQRIIKQTPEIKEKLFFINGPINQDQEDIEDIINWKQYEVGNVLNIGVDFFCESLHANIERISDKSSNFEFSSFREIDKSGFKTFAPADSLSTRELLKFGRIDDEIMFSNLNNTNYSVERYEETEIYSSIISDNRSCVYMVNGDMGNGKSMLLDRLKFRLSETCRVFEYQKAGTSLHDETREIASLLDSKVTVVIIDNYTKHLYLLRAFKNLIQPTRRDIVFILTSRSIYNENYLQTLRDNLDISKENVVYIPLGNFSPGDSESVANQLIYSNYLDVFAGSSSNKKIRHIRNEYGDYYGILVNLIQREDFILETKELYEQILASRQAHSILVQSCILSLLGTAVPSEDLLAMNDLYSIPQDVRNNDSLRVFLNVGNSDFEMKSSIFARYLIKNCIKKDSLIDLMYAMAVNADKCLSTETVRGLRQDLISVSNTTLVLDGSTQEETKKHLIEFYNKLKTLDNFDSNPHFWVQYAMTCMDIKDYDRAFKNLEVASDRDSKQAEKYENYSPTYEITIQYQRCSLESSIHKGECGNPADILSSAIYQFTTLSKNNKINNHKLFKHNQKISIFYDLYSSKIDTEEKKKIYRHLEKYEAVIEKYLTAGYLSEDYLNRGKRNFSIATTLKNKIFKDIFI